MLLPATEPVVAPAVRASAVGRPAHEVPAVEVIGLIKNYGRRRAVDGLSLHANMGAITAIVGPNGAGKTTTLECCEGYLRADGGTVRVLGVNPSRRRRTLRKRVGVLLQSGGVYGRASALEMLRHAGALYASPVPLEVLLERLDLATVARTPYRRLSGGEQRRVGLALALIGRPELLFLDEPTSGLDPHAKRTVWSLLEEVRSQGVAVVVTTHAMDEVERLADAVYVVERGRVLTAGSPAELLDRAAASSVSFRAPAGLALPLLQDRLPGSAYAEETIPGSYRVTGAFDPQLLTLVTSWCASQGVVIQDVVVSRRSLEDVYLELTGAHR